MSGINLTTVGKPEDFLLLEYGMEIQFSSEHYSPKGELRGNPADFFSEIFLELIVDLDDIFDRERILFRGVTGKNSWTLLIDRFGYLILKEPENDVPIAKAPMPLSLFAKGKNDKIGLVIANPAYVFRESAWKNESLAYCRVLLLWSPNPQTPFKVICDTELKNFQLNPVPERIEIPNDSKVRCAKAFNTSRHRIFEIENDEDGPEIVSNFENASRVFSFWRSDENMLNIFTGPEFVRSDSYWLFCKVTGAKPNETRLRINHIFGYAKRTPGMAPRFFWSSDRNTWSECEMVEPVDDTGNYYPLLKAPAENFHLSTSIPFLTKELNTLLETADESDFIKNEVIGESVGGNEIHLLRMTDDSLPSTEKKQIALIIGQHSPMEMIGAHLIAPMIDYLAANPELLKKFELHIVPIVNIDCATWGSDGVNLNKRNTNRCWFENIQPETRSVIDYFTTAAKKIDIFIDIHAGGLWRNHTLLRISPDFLKERFPGTADQLIKKQNNFNHLLEKHAGIRFQDGMDHIFRSCCAKDWFKVNYPDGVSCDLELSTCTWFDPKDKKTKPVTQESLKVVGTGLIQALTNKV